jgi:tRNA threonylcarbamoyladenosine biosynthesis protein TsaB
VRTLEVVPLEGGTFSAQLVPQISDTLNRHGLTKRNIDGLAVVSGPGSFTGLRVGLAAVKALAEVLQKPIAGVSLMEAVVHASGIQGEGAAALDAGRGEVYTAEFRVSGSRAEMSNQRLLTLAELVSANSDQIITADVKIADFLCETKVRVIRVDRPRADLIARLGFEKIQSGEIISPEALDANYIRRSDAEVKKQDAPM